MRYHIRATRQARGIRMGFEIFPHGSDKPVGTGAVQISASAYRGFKKLLETGSKLLPIVTVQFDESDFRSGPSKPLRNPAEPPNHIPPQPSP